MDKKKLTNQVEKFFSEQIRPAIQMDGGDIYLLGIEPDKTGGYTVRVTLAGACVGCGLAGVTLQMGVEARLKEKFEDINKIEVV